MVCNSCGAQNNDGAAFCAICGTPFTQQPGGQPFNGQQQFNNQQQFYGQQPYGQPVYAQPMRSYSFQERNIVMAVVFSLITFGIYGIYWFIKLTDETNELSGDPNATSGGVAFLLTLVTLGIYGIYWYYKRGQCIDQYYASRGFMQTSNAVLYLVLGLVFGIAAYCLMQNELNKAVTGQ